VTTPGAPAALPPQGGAASGPAEPGPRRLLGGAGIHWGAEALWQQLEPLLPGLSVEVLPEVASTNTLLVERARADHAPCLLVAEAQTAGRGRLGRAWVSAPGASLTFSIALPLAPRSWSGLSLAVGLAVADALDPAPATSPKIGLKWPNDLWLRNRKLGGILIETVVRGNERIVVAGIGLNLQPQAIDGTASLDEIDGGVDADAPAVLARIALPLVRALLDFQAHGFEAVAAAYARRDVLRGHAVHTIAGGVAAGVAADGGGGTAEGVDGDGALCVRNAAGELHRVVSGEVSVRLAPTSSPASASGSTAC